MVILGIENCLALHERPWYAYGLLKSAEFAKKKGYSRLTAIEFGVASGRGIRVLLLFKKEIEKIVDIKLTLLGLILVKVCQKLMIIEILPDKYVRVTFR